MKLKHQMEISDTNPYEDDLLNRSEFGQTLSTVVSEITGSLTFSVNGPWGTGKTFFLKRWNQSLKNDGFTTIYFSAWEDDYCEDALIALLGQIWSHIKDNDWKEIGKTLKEITRPLVQQIGVNALKKVVSAASLGIVELDKETLKSHSENMLEEYATSAANLKTVKARLAEAAEKCRATTGKPLVIIIDELDRCRPLFAIELLEKIKHFFEVPGLIFVLGIDREQLGHSIRSVYGDQMDVEGYLRRFIDLEFLLKPVITSQFLSSILKKYNADLTTPLQQQDIESTADWGKLIATCFNLSLREMEYFARTLALGLIIDRNVVEYAVFPVLIAFKLRDEEFYRKVIQGNVNATEFTERLISRHNAWLLFGLDPQTQESMPGGTRGFHLIAELYQFSPYAWYQQAQEDLHANVQKGGRFQAPTAPSKEFFHPVIQKQCRLGEQNFHYPYARPQDPSSRVLSRSINDLIKCIELSKFDVRER